jgi:hypothetical protein
MTTTLTRDDLARALDLDEAIRRRLEFVAETKGYGWTGVDYTLERDTVRLHWDEYCCGSTEHYSEDVSFDDILAPDDALIAAREARVEAARIASIEQARAYHAQQEANKRGHELREYKRLHAIYGGGA